MPYSVHLVDAPSDLPEQASRAAESRFRRTLERALANSDGVVQAYRAWQLAEASAADELSEDDIALAKKWIKAAQQAYQDGFRELGECEAYFDIRVTP